MSKLVFGYPFMLFGKCGCTNQIPIQSMEVYKQSEGLTLKFSLDCHVCGNRLHKVINIEQRETDMTNYINVFKVIPTLKDELCIIKLDTVMAKIQEDNLKLYGTYSYLRFWDNIIQRDKIKIDYKME